MTTRNVTLEFEILSIQKQLAEFELAKAKRLTGKDESGYIASKVFEFACLAVVALLVGAYLKSDAIAGAIAFGGIATWHLWGRK